MPALGLRRTVWRRRGAQRARLRAGGAAGARRAAPPPADGIARRAAAPPAARALDPAGDRPLGRGLLRLRGALDAAARAPARRRASTPSPPCSRASCSASRSAARSRRASRRAGSAPRSASPSPSSGSPCSATPPSRWRDRLPALVASARGRTRRPARQRGGRRRRAAPDHALHRRDLSRSPCACSRGLPSRPPPRRRAAYAWNTVGAIVGALGAGFVLLPRLGFEGTVNAARRDESRARRGHGARLAAPPYACSRRSPPRRRGCAARAARARRPGRCSARPL